MAIDTKAIRSVLDALDGDKRGMELYFEGHRLAENVDGIVSCLESSRAIVRRLSILLAAHIDADEGLPWKQQSEARTRIADGITRESARLRETTDLLESLLTKLNKQSSTVRRLSRQLKRLHRMQDWALRKT